jgi:cyclic di-GMP phosphodiesterase
MPHTRKRQQIDETRGCLAVAVLAKRLQLSQLGIRSDSRTFMDAVLVVEDEQPMRSLLERWLRSSGYEADSVASADEALNVASAHPPAVAICDLRMPGRDGVWLARELRARHPDTALIVATGAPNPRELGELPGEIVEYLFKPFSRERLDRAVQRGLTWHRASGTRRWTARLARQQAERAEELRQEWKSRRVDSTGELIEALKAVFADLPGAFDHAMRVSRLAALAGRQIRLAAGEIEVVERAALLHDLGKVAVADALLGKPAALLPEERDLVQRYPEIAFESLKDHAALGEVAAIVRGTTEWFGGGGYPVGLEGPAIPLASRIIAVADAYDTMTHARVYRDAVTPAEAVFELLRCRGSQFDPEVVRAFLDGVTAH